ncbi:hypothetical protein HMI54_009156 [Coelomomyces lativittatus]|nr:hypothetical protein HMI54_009156 [Coelomomyces lativittatus]
MEFDWTFLSRLVSLGFYVGPYFIGVVNVLHAIGICTSLQDQSLLHASLPKSWASLLVLSFGGGSLASLCLGQPWPFLLKPEPVLIYTSVWLLFRTVPQRWLPGFRPLWVRTVLKFSDSVLRTQAAVSVPWHHASSLPWVSNMILGSLAACGGGWVHRIMVTQGTRVKSSWWETYLDLGVSAGFVFLHHVFLHVGFPSSSSFDTRTSTSPTPMAMSVSGGVLLHFLYLSSKSYFFSSSEKPPRKSPSSTFSSMHSPSTFTSSLTKPHVQHHPLTKKKMKNLTQEKPGASWLHAMEPSLLNSPLGGMYESQKQRHPVSSPPKSVLATSSPPYSHFNEEEDEETDEEEEDQEEDEEDEEEEEEEAHEKKEETFILQTSSFEPRRRSLRQRTTKKN